MKKLVSLMLAMLLLVSGMSFAGCSKPSGGPGGTGESIDATKIIDIVCKFYNVKKEELLANAEKMCIL